MAPGALVASAFQNVSAEELLNPRHSVPGDVWSARTTRGQGGVMELARRIPELRPVDGGRWPTRGT